MKELVGGEVVVFDRFERFESLADKMPRKELNRTTAHEPANPTLLGRPHGPSVYACNSRDVHPLDREILNLNL